jgi:hypothetical protein
MKVMKWSIFACAIILHGMAIASGFANNPVNGAYAGVMCLVLLWVFDKISGLNP